MKRFWRSSLIAGVFANALLASFALAPHAEEPARAGACGALTPLPPSPAPIPPAAEGRRLPLDSITHHRLDLRDRTLCFTATAGTIDLITTDTPSQNIVAEVAYTAYALDGVDPQARPVTFAFNGGPGIASAWLQLGAIGPWRLPMEGAALAPSAPPHVSPNQETWLDFTDLVFIDPVGTGYSRSSLSQDEQRHRFWSVDGDIETLSDVVWRWLVKHGRLASPKFIIGESYGGFRGPRVVHTLRTHWNIGVNGLILVSPVLDFGRFNGPFNTFDWVAHLPSFAAAELATKGPVTREKLAEVERYATGDYLADLMRGVNDSAAIERITQRVAAMTGLDPAFVRRLAGRIPASAFQREFARREHRVTSLYDAGITGFDPNPEAPASHFADPMLDALQAPLASAAIDLYGQKLGWKIETARYELINGNVNHNWDWGRGEPEAISNLRDDLALDPRLRVLIAHGFTDLVTPYFETKMLIDQIPVYGDPGRLRLAVYEGGHMPYTRDPSRKALREDGRALIEGR